MLDAIQNLDKLIILNVDKYITNSFIIMFFNFFTILGYFASGWIVFFIMYSLKRKESGIWYFWTISFTSAFLVTDVLLKNLIRRLRPFIELANISIQTIEPHSFSFPSSHAIFSGTAVYIFFKLEKRILPRLIILTCSLLISLSRIILKVHYPSDVIVGYCLGFSLAFLVGKLIKADRYVNSSRKR